MLVIRRSAVIEATTCLSDSCLFNKQNVKQMMGTLLFTPSVHFSLSVCLKNILVLLAYFLQKLLGTKNCIVAHKGDGRYSLTGGLTGGRSREPNFKERRTKREESDGEMEKC